MRAVRIVPLIALAGILTVSLLARSVVAATTVTWTTESDFQAGTLSDVDAKFSTGQLLLTNVATPWVKVSANPVFGPGLRWDSDLVEMPSVLYESGGYKMWYSGCINSQCAIGYATSGDGISWTRFASNPVLVGNSASWDHSLGNPFVMHDGPVYRMWYAGIGYAAVQIGYATSLDGTAWTRYGTSPVNLIRQTWDAAEMTIPTVIKVGATFVMYFSGHPGSSVYSMGRATSTDGFNWTADPANPLMVASDAWEESSVQPTSLIEGPAGYDLYYTAGQGLPQIGHASSIDGRSWTKDPANPVLNVGGTSSWDRGGVAHAKVVNASGTMRIYYGGQAAFDQWRIGAADYSLGSVPARYQTSGFFISDVVDSGLDATSWNFIDWSGSVPGGTGIGVTVAVGSTSNPDASWTTLASPVTSPGPTVLSLPSARFAQIGVVLVTLNESMTPTLDDVSLTYGPAVAGTPPPNVGLGNLGLIALAIIVPVAVALILILVLVVRRHPTMPSAPAAPPFTYQSCPRCGTANGMENRFCTNCGTPIGGPPR